MRQADRARFHAPLTRCAVALGLALASQAALATHLAISFDEASGPIVVVDAPGAPLFDTSITASAEQASISAKMARTGGMATPPIGDFAAALTEAGSGGISDVVLLHAEYFQIAGQEPDSGVSFTLSFYSDPFPFDAVTLLAGYTGVQYLAETAESLQCGGIGQLNCIFPAGFYQFAFPAYAPDMLRVGVRSELAIPEPASLALLILGLGCVGLGGRKNA